MPSTQNYYYDTETGVIVGRKPQITSDCAKLRNTLIGLIEAGFSLEAIIQIIMKSFKVEEGEARQIYSMASNGVEDPFEAPLSGVALEVEARDDEPDFGP